MFDQISSTTLQGTRPIRKRTQKKVYLDAEKKDAKVFAVNEKMNETAKKSGKRMSK